MNDPCITILGWIVRAVIVGAFFALMIGLLLYLLRKIWKEDK